MRGNKWLAMAALVAVAATALAGDMTPQELTTKLANCKNCKAMANYPELGPQLRPDIATTSNGFVSVMMVADPKVLPLCEKFHMECENNMKEAAALTPAEFEKTFCPVCASFAGFMGRKDVKVENVKGSMGSIMVATSSTPEGTAVLHSHVKLMKDAMAVMPQAMAEMMKTAKPKTATTDQ